ncbi:MAG: hypothetical protein KA604_00340 [Candidatus Saccharimonas sp.]|nr:hypothetical protein [Candidatus Saccharimonas sp.]
MSFTFLDGHYFESICDSLCLIKSHVSVGTIIVIDDYE